MPHKRLTPESLSAWVHDSIAREYYIDAFRRSDFEAMLLYYKQNYPCPPYQEEAAASFPINKVQASVLQIHGLQDQYLLPGGLNNTWEWLENNWTLLTIPKAEHFALSSMMQPIWLPTHHKLARLLIHGRRRTGRQLRKTKKEKRF